MPRLLINFCCCFRPQQCKKVESECDRAGSNGSASQSKSVAHSTSSIITQVTKDQKQLPNPVIRRQVNDDDPANNNSSSINNLSQSGTSSQLLPVHQARAKIYESNFLLPPPHPLDAHKKCLIVDLDETLVHSSFKPVKNADFVIPVEIDNVVHQVHVLKRPHTDIFLEKIGELFECVLFTASLDMYADPVADLLDRKGVFRSRLFREACVFYDGNYVKDLTRLGRDLSRVVIIDNSPISYAFHPENAVAVRTWFDDPNDSELLDLIPLLEKLAHSDDIYSVLRTSFMGGNFTGNYE